MPAKSESKQAAIAAGEKFYIGKPCKYGHDGKRYTDRGGCVGCEQLRRQSKGRPGSNPYGGGGASENYDRYIKKIYNYPGIYPNTVRDEQEEITREIQQLYKEN